MPELPTGTVTFLFTDIVGSTALWERHPNRMRAASVRHDEIIEGCVMRHEGRLVRPRGEGDSRFAVFPFASHAAAAAGAIGEALHAEPWPPETPIRVRMALHTGEADLRDGDYYGSAVNRCARLRSLAHAGQILLSQATQELIREGLPEGWILRDLGEHRLKDLSRPERVHQLSTPALPSEFPPLSSLDRTPNNLPVSATNFIGRERELEEVKRRLSETRLLTLVGPGGVGKSRLSLQAAAERMDEYRDGVWLVELAPVSDPSLVPRTLASVLRLEEGPGQTVEALLLERLRDRRLLLILDNCEHLLDACADLAEQLLRSCPHMKILASSREGLGISGESLYRLPSLGLPEETSAPEVEALVRCDSVRLFLERARQVQPTFSLTEGNAADIRTLCRRLDGIPLALELAAARVRAVPITTLVDRLDDRFRLLTGGSRTALPRQQTLQALIDWSHTLLTDAERGLLRRLSVFSGGWTLEAAEAVGAGEGIEEWEALDLLTSLVDKSLVTYDEDRERYRLLETIRQYGRDRLLEAGEGERVRDRHLDYFTRWSDAKREAIQSAASGEALRSCEAEMENLRTALEWSLQTEPTADSALQMGTNLRAHWSLKGRREGLDWLRRALEKHAQEDSLRAKGLQTRGTLEIMLGQFDPGWEHLEAARSLAQRLGDARTEAMALNVQGIALAHRGQYEAAAERYREAELRFIELGERNGAAQAAFNQAMALLDQGKLDAAERLLLELRAEFLAEGPKGQIIPPMSLGVIALLRGDLQCARRWAEEGVEYERSHGLESHWATAILALVTNYEGDTRFALRLLQGCLRHFHQMEARRAAAHILTFLSLPMLQMEEAERAVRLLGSAQAIRSSTGAVPNPLEHRMLQESTEKAIGILGEDGFWKLHAQGEALSFDQAANEGLAVSL